MSDPAGRQMSDFPCTSSSSGEREPPGRRRFQKINNPPKDDTKQEEQVEQEEEKEEIKLARNFYQIAVAIDFGSSYSGWAFSSRNDFERNPEDVFTYNWVCDGGVMSKTRTCILFDRMQRFDSFGYEAYQKFSELCTSKKNAEWFYFTLYKMDLYKNTTLSENSKIKAVDGKKMNAMTVFSESIKFLVDHFRKESSKMYKDVKEKEVGWVVTVPAIWNEKAKQFMRKAAEKAGIPSDQLTIALEPEAASLYCKSLPLKKDERFFSVFKPGTKYMVLDLGGGTFDITVNQMAKDGYLEELLRANGGDSGGTKVNKAFWNLLSEIFGKQIIDDFREQCFEDALTLEESFEFKKKFIKDIKYTDEKEIFTVPVNLQELVKKKIEEEKITLADLLSESQHGNDIEFDIKLLKLKIKRSTLQQLYHKPCDDICKAVTKVISAEVTKDMDTILMVGGFAESDYLYNLILKRIQRKRKNIQLLKPAQAGWSVLMGAVIFCHDPSVFSRRVCRYTYGVRCNERFDPKYDSETKMRKDESGEIFCEDRFSKHISIGEQVKTEEFYPGKKYSPFLKNQKTATVEVYVSKDPNPRYTTDSSCYYLGKLKMELTDMPHDEQTVIVSMKFGKTELTCVEVVEEKTNKTASVTLDFLG